MTTFEEKVNAYRENKRLIEELEAMNDAVKAEIIAMMQGAPEVVAGACNVFLSDVDAWAWINLFRNYRGKMYTAAEIGSIPEVITK